MRHMQLDALSCRWLRNWKHTPWAHSLACLLASELCNTGQHCRDMAWQQAAQCGEDTPLVSAGKGEQQLTL